uniref:Rieske 2Fe-2S domain-containing protein n=1 Tax=Trichocoleus desertorum TaxID=1481672 RepID=UPI0025B35339|nr:Rieske 2Fe-2S domain-containing protein [Trichocoleus desertorum]
MKSRASQNSQDWTELGNRRHFLKYLAGSAIASVTLGYLRPPVAQGHEGHQHDSTTAMTPACASTSRSQVALDRKGQPIQVKSLLSSAKPGSRVPVKGLPKQATAYLVINEQAQIAVYAIKPICPHKGCVVDWQPQQNRFFCPCHDSEFDAKGRVLKGPAKTALPLVTVAISGNQVRLADCQPATSR